MSEQLDPGIVDDPVTGIVAQIDVMVAVKRASDQNGGATLTPRQVATLIYMLRTLASGVE